MDLAAWLQREKSNGDPEIASFVGSPWLERNRKTLTSLIARNSERGKSPAAWDLFWFRPGGTIWGLTEDLQTTLGERESHVTQESIGRRRIGLDVDCTSVSQFG